jgi:NADH-quinone oxidoreductase subunit L
METAIVFLPLLGAIIAGLFGRQIGDKASQFVTSGALVLSAVLSWVVFIGFAGAHDQANGSHTVQLFTWIASGDFVLDWALRIDTLTAVMLVVVTTVSSVVHIYSVGYMADDPSKPRFMAYLSLFTFAMLMLVTADNLVQLFFGWEGVGLCSYLLIGFWYHKPEANASAMKAFLVNRVGDFGFALGIFGCFFLFGTVSFDGIFAAAPNFSDATLLFLGTEWHAPTIICILLFIGAMGKSAQIGLHTWLPDAMEGPTPVSALIHAATMVTAGVFMVARLSPLFELSDTALTLVTYVGGMTAIFAATIGLTQFDIKRVIAYSTCSQLGYMFFALGVGAYGAGIFHLMTHAFFKALLFLGAGCVIHAMHHEQDMRKMGGIWKKIPITYAFMWVGSLALAGIPPFAGYFSKDIVLEAAYAAHSGAGNFAFAMGIAAAFLTAFYSWRLLLMTFHGKTRADKHTYDHAHDAPWVMLLPLVVLVIGAIGSGYIAYDWFVGDNRLAFWGASIAQHADDVIEHAHHVPMWVKYLPLAVGLLGIGLAYVCYILVPSLPGIMVKTFKEFHAFFFNKWYFDELYDLIFVRPAKWLGHFFWKRGDGDVIDGLGPDGVSSLAAKIGQKASALQSGYVYHYAFAMMIGVVALITWYILGHSV